MPPHNTPSEAQQTPSSMTPPQYDPEPQRDAVRGVLALGLVAALLVVVGFALYSTHGDYEETKDLLQILLPALTGLIGSALGFYFGSKAKEG